MTITLTLGISAALVALAAAVRSTWSPCGQSMLSTITPMGERGRGTSFRATASWFIAGSLVGGALLGGLMAVLAQGVHLAGLSGPVTASVALAGVLVAIGSDLGLGGHRLPVHRRQVNERWLDHYRPWVYGAGFGVQIGCGLATYITTAAVYLTVWLAALCGRPWWALGLGIGFGGVRGAAVLLGRSLTTTEAMVSFHRRFFASSPVASWIVIAVEALVATAILVVTADPAAFGVLVALVVVGLGLVLGSSTRWIGVPRPDAMAGRPGRVERTTSDPSGDPVRGGQLTADQVSARGG